MTTAAAWQRTIDRLDPEAFGENIADDVLGTAAELMGDPGPDGYTIDLLDLRVLLGMAGLAGFRKLLDAVRLEAMTGDADEDDPSYHALVTTIDTLGTVCGLLDADQPAEARALIDRIRASWEAATEPEET